jgi:RimJ/RimL family protein N-acetyltransferase
MDRDNLAPLKLLETSRLLLREFVEQDAQLLFDLDSDAEVMRFISKGQPTDMARIQNVIIPKFLNYYKLSPPRGFWAAHELDNDEFIGWFHMRPDIYQPEEMELGYRLKRSAWGRGFATELSRALVEKALGPWGYEKVSARTLEVNRASQRVMEKAGLIFETKFLFHTETLPDWTEEERRGVKYGLTREQFKKS